MDKKDALLLPGPGWGQEILLHIVVNHQNYKNVALHSFHCILFLLQLKFCDEKKVVVIGNGVFTGFLPIYWWNVVSHFEFFSLSHRCLWDTCERRLKWVQPSLMSTGNIFCQQNKSGILSYKKLKFFRSP